MMNVIAILNEVYSPSERDGIKPKYREFVDEVLLYGGYHTKAQQKKIFKNLFGKDDVDRATHRNNRSIKPKSVSISATKSNKKSKRKTKKVNRSYNNSNSSEEVRAAYKEYLSTMPRNNNN